MKAAGLTSIAVRGKDCVAMVTQKKVPDRLLDPKSVTHLFKITPNVGCLATGIITDARHLVAKCREKAADFKFKVRARARVRLRDVGEMPTARASARSCACVRASMGARTTSRARHLYG